ncbi:MAG: GlsB/YeaQ/YmgE family stress response membrane protein [Anaerolineales bacterium]|nr:GlsB/YeaQ/YmgE family stress response membrane protein [Anaerolineales bacterium]
MGCVSWIIFGAIAGWVASIITGNSGRNGCLTNIILGVIGAGVGGAIVNFFGFGGTAVTGFNFQSFIVAVIGAVVVLVIFNLIRGR